MMLNIYAHLLLHICVNSACAHVAIHASICAQVYRRTRDSQIPAAVPPPLPFPNPECVICCHSAVDWESPTNADLLLAGLLCDFSLL